MDTRFANIKVLIWDFDGTLYKPNKALWHAVREAEYKTITHHTNWPRDRVEREFNALHKVKYPSATEVVAKLTGIPIAEAAVEMENYFDRRDFIRRDRKLISLFKKLKNFRHFTLANGAIAKHKETLAVLGVPALTFEEMVTSETVGVTKPHEKGFLYILGKTKLPAAGHLMIGDREAVDLVPAKKLGMKTCLVWSNVKSAIADVTLPTVYDLSTLLL